MGPDHHAGGVEPGGALLSRISNEIVHAIKDSFGKGPDAAKSYMVDDLLFVVMRGGMTAAEQTLLDAGEANLVRDYRQRYENHMAGRLTGLIEELTGRKVVNHQSQVLFEPFMSVEIFVFDTPPPESTGTPRGVEATAVGQYDRPDVGGSDGG